MKAKGTVCMFFRHVSYERKGKIRQVVMVEMHMFCLPAAYLINRAGGCRSEISPVC